MFFCLGGNSAQSLYFCAGLCYHGRMDKIPEKKSDRIANYIFYGAGLLIAFVGFVCVLFVGVFLAASSVYGIYLSFSLQGAGKVALAILLSLMMLAASAFMAYADVLIVKTVMKRADEWYGGDKGGGEGEERDKTVKSAELAQESGEAEITEDSSGEQ